MVPKLRKKGRGGWGRVDTNYSGNFYKKLAMQRKQKRSRN
jgi:hypothetical protein